MICRGDICVQLALIRGLGHKKLGCCHRCSRPTLAGSSLESVKAARVGFLHTLHDRKHGLPHIGSLSVSQLRLTSRSPTQT